MSKWIKCSERLPEGVDDVITSGVFKGEKRVCTGWLRGGEFVCNDGMFEHEDITHWMPLPEPPKDE